MSEELKIRIEGLKMETIYKDGLEELAKDMGAEVGQVCRASEVEWEDHTGHTCGNCETKKGWVVRSLHTNGVVCVDGEGRVTVSREDMGNGFKLKVFETREEAIAAEVKFFWQLLPPKEERTHG